jgi:formate hydrogenlyase subunit 4
VNLNRYIHYYTSIMIIFLFFSFFLFKKTYFLAFNLKSTVEIKNKIKEGKKSIANLWYYRNKFYLKIIVIPLTSWWFYWIGLFIMIILDNIMILMIFLTITYTYFDNFDKVYYLIVFLFFFNNNLIVRGKMIFIVK